MGYIILYGGKYGHSGRFKDGYPAHTRDFHFACSYNRPDRAMQAGEFPNAVYDGGHRIEVLGMEG